MMRRRMPWVRQMELADCAAACLGTVLGYHGRQVPLAELRDATGANRDGVDARALMQAARRYGLTAEAVAADVDDLDKLPSGSILHWQFAHFVVLEGLGRTWVGVVDPMLGRRRVSLEAFRRAYTGVAIVLLPGPEFRTERRRAPGSWRYLRPLLKQPRALTRVLVMSVVLRVLALALPLLTGLLVDEIVPRDDRHLLAVTAATMTAVLGYYFLADLLRGHLLLQLSTRLDVNLTQQFVDHLVALPYSFFLRRTAGDLMMRLRSNTVVREIVTAGALSGLLDGTLAGLYLILLAAVSPPLAVLVLGLALLQVMILLFSWRRNQHLMSESLHVQAKSQAYTFELLAGIETLKAAGAESRAAEHWRGLFIDEVNVGVRRGRLNANVSAAMNALRVGSPLVLLTYGGLLVLDGQLSLGTMLAAGALAAGFLEPLGVLVETGLELQLLGSYMERINDVLDSPREQDGAQVSPVPDRLTGRVRAQDVSFSYGALSPPVIMDVTLDVRPGQQIGIVGRSGSGKSTLAHLLLGLYPPTTGRILFDDMDLTQLALPSLRRQLGIVTQRPYIFGSSLRDNITLGDPDVSDEAVVRAARIACIHDEIDAMPLGYSTPLIDRGASLSGGQQQRLALARALVHQPAVLLLDEATSDLDTMTERQVHENLDTLGCTRIVIAHRLSTVSRADLILVVESGRIVQRGTHVELLAEPGGYRDLVQAQYATDPTVAASVPEPGALDGSASTIGALGRPPRP
jgi:ABC-type bacteriocin/lantibiotic exporter with double-glycine peptidase domain